ncbi:tetratricopeptide repeat protein [Nocardia barduliensis]|uniref:tetratricopeptide repeat protein n=1 Tax=Nocardia barduliensis TaxID=2736643 RepID=UPI0015746A9F|nr:tetratricopeptide repeat protein [Nocardia barduliensis]
MKRRWWRSRHPEQQLSDSSIGGSVISIRHVVGDVTITDRADSGHRYWCEPFPRAEKLPVEQARAKPSLLLQPRYSVVRFLGRDSELTELDHWLAAPEPIAVHLVHAAGGEGKSRLAGRFCENATATGWAAWRAIHTTEASGLPGAITLTDRNAVLLVVDDAHRWPVAHLASLVTNLRTITSDGVKARVLLLARATGYWWSTLSARLRELGVATSVAALAPLGLRFDRASVFDTAVTGFSRALQLRDLPANRYRVGIDLGDPRFDSVLSIQMAGLAAIHSRIRNVSPGHDPAAVSAYLLGLEYTDWADRFERKLITTSPEVMRRVVHLATLTGGMSHSDARSLLSSVGLAVDEAHAGRIVDDHSLCYPPTRTSVLTPLQPDRLGEDFLALNTPGNPDPADDALPADPWTVDAAHQLVRRGDGATPPWVSAAIVRLVEAAGRWPHLAPTLLYPSLHRDPALAATTGGATLTRLAGLPGITPDILTAIQQHLTDNPGLDTTTATTALDTALLPHRIASTTDPAERADLYRRYSRQLRAAQRYQQALTAAEQAAELYRSLNDTDPDHYGPFLAAALEILGTRLGDVGRNTEALGPVQEAVELYRRLAETEAETYLPELGNALTVLGIRLGRLGRNHEALDAAQEGVGIYRRLAEADPARHVVELASPLNNIATRLGALGRHYEALDAVREATTLYRDFAETDPDTHLLDFTRMLNNLGIRLGELGRHREALDVAQETVALSRQLAEADFDAHLPLLAEALMQLGSRSSRLGHHHEALEAAREGVSLYRRLATANPDTYLSELAEALTQLGLRLGQLGHHHEALEAAQEGVGLYRRLAESDPDAYLASMTSSLNNLGSRLGDLGRPHEAVETVRGAVALYRQLAERNPDTHLQNLARSLNNLGIRLGDLGHHREAFEASQEAVTLFRQLSETNPDAYLTELAETLTSLGIRLGRLGHHPEALETGREAVALHRRLAEADPGANPERRAESLLFFAQNTSRAKIDMTAGLTAIQESITLFGALAEQVPEAYQYRLTQAREILSELLQHLSTEWRGP